MKIIGNILWILFGGLFLFLMWLICGLVLCITIVGIPFGMQCFKFASLMLTPFGKEIIYGGGITNIFMNIIWIVFFGWELALSSVIIGLLWFLTIIGIPVGIQCFKFAKLALTPFGSQVV